VTTPAWTRFLVHSPITIGAALFGYALAIGMGLLWAALVTSVLLADADVPTPARALQLEMSLDQPGFGGKWSAGTPMAFFDHWADAGIEVEAATRYYSAELSVRSGHELRLLTISFVDEGYLDIFSPRVLAGNASDALKDPGAVIVSQRIARMLALGPAPVGSPVEIAGAPFRIGAIIADRSSNSAVRSDVLINIRSGAMPEPYRLDAWWSARGSNFLRLKGDATSADVAAKAFRYFSSTPFFAEQPRAYQEGVRFRSVSIDEVSLHGAGGAPVRRALLGAEILAVTFLCFAVINYFNLYGTWLQTAARELAILRVMGQTTREAWVASLVEHAGLFGIATVAGMALALPIAPVLGNAIGADIVLTGALLAEYGLAGVLASVVLAIVGATLAARIDAQRVFSGAAEHTHVPGVVVRDAVVAVQAAVTVALSAIATVLLVQMSLVDSQDPGYRAQDVIIVEATADMRDERIIQFKERLEKMEGVQAVGLAWDVVGRGRRKASVSFLLRDGSTVKFALHWVGPGLFQSYGVAPVAGRLFDQDIDKQGDGFVNDGDKIVVNVDGTRALGFQDPADAVGRRVTMGDLSVEVIGVVPNAMQRSARDGGGPAVYSIFTPRSVSVISVLARNASAVQESVARAWSSVFPDEVLRMKTAAAHLRETYATERAIAALVSAMALCAALAGGFSLYAYVAYAVRCRQREVAIRRLLGSSTLQLAIHLARRMLVSLVVGATAGAAIALPICGEYLSAFATRTPLQLELILLCGLACLLVAGWALLWSIRVLSASAPADLLVGASH
jgi:putative ABC transport system permease protein